MHQKLEREFFVYLNLIDHCAFNEVAWKEVYNALHIFSWLFQLWACKQVTNTAAANVREARGFVNRDPNFPSCDSAIDTCSHVLGLNETRRVDLIHKSIELVDSWLKEVKT